MKLLLDSNSVAIFVGMQFELTDEGVMLPGAISTQYTTANATVIEADEPPVPASNAYKREGDTWVCIDQAAVDGYLASQRAQSNARMKEEREKAYAGEADPLFFKAQRGEATMEEWNAKVAQIKARFPYQQ